DGRRRVDGRRALEDPLRVPSEPRHAAEHQDEPRHLAGDEGGVCRRRRCRRRDVVDGRPGRYRRIDRRRRERSETPARGLSLKLKTENWKLKTSKFEVLSSKF